MTADLLQMIIFLQVLLFGAAAEELLPKVCGIGFPFLLAAAQIVTLRCSLVQGALFAMAAGAAEDALCALPAMTSFSYFLFVALLARWLQMPKAMVVLFYPCYQVWLATWLTNLGGSVFVRILVAVPVGLVTTWAVGWAYAWMRRKAAIDDVD